MVWFTQAQEIAKNGVGTGRWRMTARSDEGGGGPFGDTSHDHSTAEEAEACEACDEYVSGVTGFPSRKATAARKELHERAEFERLSKKFNPSDDLALDGHNGSGG
jgi:hypothetical protein